MTNDEALEQFGQCIDTIENLIAAMAMPLPAEIHVAAMKDSLPELKDRIKQVYFDFGGEDMWNV